MPYVHLSTSVALDADGKGAVRDAIAELMPLLPGKTRENTMIHIDSGCFMSKGDISQPCLFLDVRTYCESPLESKREFVSRLSAVLEQHLGVQPTRMYMNIIGLPEWGSSGVYRNAE